MKAVDLEAAGVNLALVTWLARHAADVKAILAGIENAAAATTLADRWTAIKSVGDLIVGDLADFPGFSGGSSPAPVNPPAPVPSGPIGPVSAASVSEVDAALGAIGDGHIINAIVTLVTNPQFLALLELILKVFGVAT